MKRSRLRVVGLAAATVMAFNIIGVQSLADGPEDSIVDVSRVPGLHPIYDEELLVGIEDANFRKAILESIPARELNDYQESLVPGGYEYPVFKTDIPNIEKIKKINYDASEKPDSEKIHSLKGLKYIKGLEELNIVGNAVSEISNEDLSELHYISTMSLDNNNLQKLDISECPRVGYLSAYNNQLTEVNLGTPYGLSFLDLGHNKLTSLDLHACRELSYLSIAGNPGIKSIDVSGNTSLKNLYAEDTGLESLDLSENTALESLHVQNASLVSLNLEKNTALERKYASDGNAKVDFSNQLRVVAGFFEEGKTKVDLKDLLGSEFENLVGVEVENGVSYDNNSGIVTLLEYLIILMVHQIMQRMLYSLLCKGCCIP